MSPQHTTKFVHHPTTTGVEVNENYVVVRGNFFYQTSPETDTGLVMHTNGKTVLKVQPPHNWQYATSQEAKQLDKQLIIPAKTPEPINLYGAHGQLSIDVQPHEDKPLRIASLQAENINELIKDIESTYGSILLVEFGDRGRKQFRSPNKILTATGERIEHHLKHYRAQDRAFTEACWKRAESNRTKNAPYYATQIDDLERLVGQQRKNKQNIERHGPF